MAAHVVDIADAVVESLNDADFAMSFTAQRMLLARIATKDLKDLKVIVVPVGRAIEIESRGSNDEAVVIHIAIIKHMNDVTDLGEADQLLLLVEQVQDFCLARDFGDMSCLEVASVLAGDTIYGLEQLRDDTTFMHIMQLTFS